VRVVARKRKDFGQARRLLAQASVYDGATRTQTARRGAVSRLIMRTLARPHDTAPRCGDASKGPAIVVSAPVSAPGRVDGKLCRRLPPARPIVRRSDEGLSPGAARFTDTGRTFLEKIPGPDTEASLTSIKSMELRCRVRETATASVTR
jgi:hypothetical protein